jgi:hypothetical protein
LGGYHNVDDGVLVELAKNEKFGKIEKLAREAYKAKNSDELGKLKSVSKQTVAGINYKMIFETQSGECEIVVFCQHWTDTYSVLSIKPVN